MSLRILAYPSFPIFNTPLKQFLSLFLQVLITLRFLAKRNYLSEVADLHGVSIPSASRILHFFCPALYRQLNNINFPTTADELKRVKDVFYKIAHFPNVDGIHGYQYRACLEMTSPIFISPAARGIPPSTFIIIKILKLI